MNIESASVESVRVKITTRVDPTGNAVEFSVTTGRRADPGTWVAGTWDTTWNLESGRVEALSPTIGTAGDLAVAADTSYDLWIRWTAGSETPVKRVGSLDVL